MVRSRKIRGLELQNELIPPEYVVEQIGIF